MKGLKKIALVAAIAAAPLASHAGMKALDDTTMGNVTGQAGVTIELETRVSIGEFIYTDEGSFAVSGIELGGATVSSSASAAAYAAAAGAGELLDNLKIDIDIADDGDAVIHVGTLQYTPVLDGNGDPVLDGNGDPTMKPVPIDWGMTADSMELRGNAGEQTTLISNMDAWGLLGALDIRVDTDDVVNGAAGTGTLNLDVAFTVEQMDFDVEFMGVGIRGLSIRGVNDFGQNMDEADLAAILGDGQDAELDGRLVALASGALGKSFAVARLDVYKGDGLGASTATDVLRVDVTDVLMDINIAETIIGGASIGTISIDNLHLSDTKLAVYGH